MKIEVGKRYRNLHTKSIDEVIWKIFFNVGYRDIKSGYESYIHYKTFQKHWIPKI